MYFDVFNPLEKWQKGDYPISPSVYVECISSSADDDGRIRISHQLMTDLEVDAAIDALVQELEVVRKKAKKELKLTLAQQLKRP